jgi:hypothetical protein
VMQVHSLQLRMMDGMKIQKVGVIAETNSSRFFIRLLTLALSFYDSL